MTERTIATQQAQATHDDLSKAKKESPSAALRDPAKASKSDQALRLLRRKRGATLAELQELTGWQAHSVRGFLSGTVKKRLGLALATELASDGVRHYRVPKA